ncbi:hypothetical protein [Helicobacter sp. 11S02596-1]|uniref:hypothetical protein n=1 Tax=Helicobacter sp. 11S02596-1 TaxID=1476194 RepID=UPI000BA74220|nr:hypothetical protein [Helicobacter sp. 11S02596-1]PAF44763.1 hypothetical protein BJI48_01890 [Helicobacter sp. 11S02596-1]
MFPNPILTISKIIFTLLFATAGIANASLNLKFSSITPSTNPPNLAFHHTAPQSTHAINVVGSSLQAQKEHVLRVIQALEIISKS